MGGEIIEMELDRFIQRKIDEGFQQGIDQGMSQGISRGMSWGINQGEKKLSTLITKLITLDRMEDVKAATSDEEKRREFYEEFGMN